MPDTVPTETAPTSARVTVLRRWGFALEWTTFGWNVVGVLVLAVLAYRAASVALLGFGLDSLIEIGASLVVIWELSGAGERRQRRALRMIGVAFVELAAYLAVQSVVALAVLHHAAASPGGIAWTAGTAVAMFALAFGKRRAGAALGNPVLVTEGRVTLIDGILAGTVLLGLLLNSLFGWWWADPIAGLVIVYYAIREADTILRPRREAGPSGAE